MKRTKLVIIGSGLAAFTAAIYAARANLQPIVYESFSLEPMPGIKNFPGFPEGTTGPELMKRIRKQALRFGTEILTEDVIAVELKERPFIVKGQHNVVQADALVNAIIDTAGQHLDLPGTDQKNQYIYVEPGSSKTNIEGVFAVGGVYNHIYYQAITAAGTGCIAALDVEKWLSEKGYL